MLYSGDKTNCTYCISINIMQYLTMDYVFLRRQKMKNTVSIRKFFNYETYLKNIFALTRLL